MRYYFGLLAAVCLTFVSAPIVGAEPSISLQPLQYREVIQKGDRKKAFIDVTNTSTDSVSVQFYVQGFKQIDSKGNLAFYEDEQLRRGILLDLNDAEIPPQKTIRLFFVVDGTKLPTGDIFAVIFAQIKVGDQSAVPSVRLGTLLSLVNDTAGSREARIEAMNVPFFQMSERLTGSYIVKNTANAATSSGYYPEVTIAIDPFHTIHKQSSKLVFAGISRTTDFAVEDARLGFYKIAITHQDSRKEQWVFMATGPWLIRLIVGVVIVMVCVAGVIVWRRLRAGV